MLTGQNGGSGEQVNEMPMPYFDPMSMFQQMNFGSQSSSSDNEASHDGAQYISDEDFKKNLSEQELMIFNAIVIAIHQQHVNR